MENRPWAAFCMSTYKRPAYLEAQLKSLLSQTFTDLEIVVSDNDPDGSGEVVAKQFNDTRIRYFKNGDNLGMIPSFNKSIERASAEFVVMVTDDDPVFPDFLMEIHEVHKATPGLALYGGFLRRLQPGNGQEIISSEQFISEILDPVKTPWMLWSSCIMRRDVLLKIKGIPDYGSPHLADHALIAMAGSNGGAVVINKQFSTLTSHDSNFSKFNFGYYVNGCKGFYEEMKKFCSQHQVSDASMNIVIKHLYHWFVTNFFTLKRYYTVTSPNNRLLNEVNNCAKQILGFEFMKGITLRYRLKNTIFRIKRMTGLLRKK